MTSLSPTPAPPAPAATGADNAASPPATGPVQPHAPEAGTIQGLPVHALNRVVLIYPRGDTTAAEREIELARVLRADGLGVGEPFPVAPRTSRRGISYYFVQDRDAAVEVERHLGGEYGEARLVRLPRDAGLPRPGTIEIATGPSGAMPHAK